MPQTSYIHISPEMCSQIHPFIRSLYNTRSWFITDVGIFAPSVASCLPLPLPLGAVYVSSKWIYMWDINIMRQLQVVDAGPEGACKVVSVDGCVLKWDVLFRPSHVMSRELRMLELCSIQEKQTTEVNAWRGETNPQVCVISGFTFCCWLMNTEWANLQLA
jgi:hypothetical protein